MASAAEIIDYYSYVGAAVKQSEYVVWTRLNCVSWETAGRVDANEKKRVNGGTNIDFVGVDIYGNRCQRCQFADLPDGGFGWRQIVRLLQFLCGGRERPLF